MVKNKYSDKILTQIKKQPVLFSTVVSIITTVLLFNHYLYILFIFAIGGGIFSIITPGLIVLTFIISPGFLSFYFRLSDKTVINILLLFLINLSYYLIASILLNKYKMDKKTFINIFFLIFVLFLTLWFILITKIAGLILLAIIIGLTYLKRAYFK